MKKPNRIHEIVSNGILFYENDGDFCLICGTKLKPSEVKDGSCNRCYVEMLKGYLRIKKKV